MGKLGRKPQTDAEWLARVVRHVNKKDCSYYPNSVGKPTLKAYVYYRAYTIAYGEPPKNKPCICHSCDNGVTSHICCVNPRHLWAGTQKENMQDASRKGRLIPSKETRKRRSESLKSHIVTKETRDKISKANTGCPHTKRTKKILREMSKGNQYRLGYVTTDETKKKISEAMTGRPAWNKGKVLGPTGRSAWNKGRISKRCSTCSWFKVCKDTYGIHRKTKACSEHVI